jgi:hypothetical protein
MRQIAIAPSETRRGLPVRALHPMPYGSGCGDKRKGQAPLVNFPASERFKLEQPHTIFFATNAIEELESHARRRSELASWLVRQRLWNAIFPFVIGALLVFVPVLGLYFLWKTPAYTRRAQVALSGLGIAGMFMQLAILHALRR